RAGSVARANPPVRGEAHHEGLWRALLDGTFDVLGTDHAPHTPEEKQRANVWEAPGGISSVEIASALMLDQVNRGRLTLETFVRLRCENPAKVMGIYPRKGSLHVGADADIAVIDMNKTTTIRPEDFFTK